MPVCDSATTVCAKGGQARAYCRRTPCVNRASEFAAWVAAVDLPQPNVTVDVSNPPGSTATQVDVRVTRDGTGASRAFQGLGSTPQGAVKDVIEKILGDPGTAEYVKRG